MFSDSVTMLLPTVMSASDGFRLAIMHPSSTYVRFKSNASLAGMSSGGTLLCLAPFGASQQNTPLDLICVARPTLPVFGLLVIHYHCSKTFAVTRLNGHQ